MHTLCTLPAHKSRLRVDAQYDASACSCVHKCLQSKQSASGVPHVTCAICLCHDRNKLRLAGIACNGCSGCACSNHAAAAAASEPAPSSLASAAPAPQQPKQPPQRVRHFRLPVAASASDTESDASPRPRKASRRCAAPEADKPAHCRCRHSGCLKLYCVCFKEGAASASQSLQRWRRSTRLALYHSWTMLTH